MTMNNISASGGFSYELKLWQYYSILVFTVLQRIRIYKTLSSSLSFFSFLFFLFIYLFIYFISKDNIKKWN